MTLRRRLTQNFILVALASLLLASVAGALLVRSYQLSLAERSVRLITAAVSARAANDDLQLDDPTLQRQVSALGARLVAVDRRGRVVAASDETLVGQMLRPSLTFIRETRSDGRPVVRMARVNRQSYFFSTLPVNDEQGRLLIALPTTTLLDSWLLLLPGVLLLSGLGAAVAALVGWRLAERLTAPVAALTDATQKMATGDYDIHVETATDVSELQTLARSFNTMASEVKQARQTQRDFLANVSHDLRTPLTSIQGFSQALMDGAVPEDQTPRVANIIYTEAARLSRLVGDLLDLARLEAGRFSMAQRDINLKSVLERCSEKFLPQAELLGISFETDIPRRPLPVHGDADRLEQVITNLIDNALTYAQDGGGHVRLVGALGGIRGSAAKNAASNGHSQTNGEGAPVPTHAGPSEEDEAVRKLGRWWIEIKVEDDGPGIPAEQKPLVFERFYRADRARGGTGMGLGLAIARQIVEAHGGDITIHDRSERGTQFVVRLPMKLR